MTQQEMADEIERLSGEPITRSAVSQALQRENITPRVDLPRYNDVIPWTVRTEHIHAYPVRMLRLLGRERSGAALSKQEESKLASWSAKLEQQNLVVAYDPDSVEGFVYVDREDGDPEDVPVRVRRVWLVPPAMGDTDG